MYDIVKAVREATDPRLPVTAKVRLGWDDPEHCFEIADAVAQAGADEIVVHARTKTDGYKADAIKWDYIRQLKAKISQPIIANGEIWTYEDGQRCMEVTGSDALMVCRGAINLPNLGNVVKHNHAHMDWEHVLELLLKYSTYEIKGDKGCTTRTASSSGSRTCAMNTHRLKRCFPISAPTTKPPLSWRFCSKHSKI
ncbi:tRNA-dihydrouridine synthase C [Photobacterium aphoticum]|uniref:tRNA-dihydrouridine synthase C n=1 Tax=Photobacterium aphoticum TaxID=754436 RepID=A0A090QWE5_9GAMM|nr:tRNA-dihydrouridine synthase C [Photobacterium aphoticum]